MNGLPKQIALRAEAALRGWRNRRWDITLTASFDADYYESQLASVGISRAGMDPIALYKASAAARSVSPNPMFDEAYYLARYADVAAAARSGRILSGFDHFVHNGVNEGRFPNRRFEIEANGSPATIGAASKAHFDEDFYLQEYTIARQFLHKMPILSPLEFFNIYGHRMGHVPRVALKRPAADRAVDPADYSALGHHSPEIIDLIRPHFDDDYYQREYGDELGSTPPFLHYLRTGQRERKHPNAWFDEAFYLAFYPDIDREIAAGRLSCGFEHYLRTGRREGRLPAFDLTACLDRVYPGVTQPVALTNFAHLERKVTPHAYKVVEGSGRRVWFLLPRINPDIFFGGYSSIIHLMEAFLGAGYTIGLFLFEDARDTFIYFRHRRPHSLLAQRHSEIEVFSALDAEPFRFGPDDIFIAYSAWQALWADAYAKHTATGSFAFLVQEYEPVFHGHDSTRFVVDMAYKLPHVAIFNSRSLEDHFRAERLGIFENDPASGDFITFEHVLTNVAPPSRRALRQRRTRKLLVYARPESHAARNLFEICLIALRRAVAANVFRRRYEFVGIGALAGPRYVDLGTGHSLEILPKAEPEEYAKVLQGTDVGLSLMYAPHPSLIPFEMVNAGAIAVTNIFANRDRAALKARSPRLVPVELTIDAIVDGLRCAVRLAEDVDLRTDGAHSVPAPAGWNDVFDRRFIETLIGKMASKGGAARLRLP
jgi:hypothetical protein